ncbi:hypothetical protein Hamer_G003763 [Homarus americanus]|uniref:Uncharacterized protein n=1 Tax=Homarus americanus TaxID=6706 RepID=A0A8J5NDN5_HOMAM|nr:hypothetical protein Hamer_G003763 [Homarus americanus]
MVTPLVTAATAAGEGHPGTGQRGSGVNHPAAADGHEHLGSCATTWWRRQVAWSGGGRRRGAATAGGVERWLRRRLRRRASGARQQQDFHVLLPGSVTSSPPWPLSSPALWALISKLWDGDMGGGVRRG